MRYRTLFCLAVLAALTLLPVLGETTLILVDGRVIRGTDVQREDDVYILTLESGQQIAFPMDLVETVAIEQQAPPERRPGPPAVVPGEPRQLGGQRPEGPTGMRQGDPRTLAGGPARPPRTSDQLEVLGAPARFADNIVDNDWQPTTDWDMDPEANNNFNPARWSEGVIDPNWQPKSAWKTDDNALDSGRSTWTKSIVDSNWTPTDGFATSVSRR